MKKSQNIEEDKQRLLRTTLSIIIVLKLIDILKNLSESSSYEYDYIKEKAEEIWGWRAFKVHNSRVIY